MELTDDEVLANRVGLLARSQSLRLRQREARAHRRAALCFCLALLALALLPLSLSLSLLLALGGLCSAALFYLVARKSRAARRALFPSVRCVFVTDSSRRYEVYFVEPTRTLLGWRQLGTQKEIT
jgi:lipopolysaccharide export LptBFGC system permease protein LptF